MLICDTGPLLAALDSADRDHAGCAAILQSTEEELVVPALVLAELDYWCHARLTPDAWLVFLEDLLDGAYRAERPTHRREIIDGEADGDSFAHRETSGSSATAQIDAEAAAGGTLNPWKLIRLSTVTPKSSAGPRSSWGPGYRCAISSIIWRADTVSTTFWSSSQRFRALRR